MATAFTQFDEFKKYLLSHHISSKSIKFYASDIRVFIRWIEKTTDDITITKELLESYESFLKRSGLPTRTVNRKLSSLRKFADFLIESRYLTSKTRINITNAPLRNVRSINILKYFQSFFKISQGYLLFFLFLLVTILGWAYFSNRRSTKDFLLEDEKGLKVNLPIVLKFDNIGTEKNLGSIVSGTSLFQIENDPTLDKNVKGYVMGRSEIDTNTQEKRIFVSNVSNSSYVFVTSLSNNYLYLKEQGDGYFIVSSNSIAKTPYRFNWIVFRSDLPIDTY